MPTEDEIERILALTDHTLCNLRITQAYHEIARAMRALTGPGANWCTFATWASKQAGQTIRHEDLARAAGSLLRSAPAFGKLLQHLSTHLAPFGAATGIDRMHETVVAAIGVREMVRRAGEAVMRGNLKVFAELGPLFARFIGEFAGDTQFDAAKTGHFVESIRPGEPPDGQEFLREAFATYNALCFEPDPALRAQQLFYAALRVGVHEQVRLQPEIADALDAPFAGSVEETRGRILAALLPGMIARLRYRIGRILGRTLPLDRALDELIDCARRLVRQFTTDHLMSLRLPTGETLRLGHDLRAEFAGPLKRPTDPKLRALLDRYDTTPDSLRETGARLVGLRRPHALHRRLLPLLPGARGVARAAVQRSADARDQGRSRSGRRPVAPSGSSGILLRQCGRGFQPRAGVWPIRLRHLE